MQNISSLLQLKQVKQVKTKQWQEKALEAISKFSDGKQFKGSIFRCYKTDERRADIAYNDCIELSKPHSRYFLKVFHSLNK